MKMCSKCNETKQFSEFNVNKRYKDGYLSWCKACMKAYRKVWEGEHKEERKGYFQNWHIENIERRHERNNFLTRLRYHFTPGYKEKKNEQKRNQRKEKYGVDEEWTIKTKIWGRNNRRKRKIEKMNGGGSHTEAEWQALCKKYDYKCLACGKKIKLTEDHVIPLSKGGLDNIDNIQPLCISCNCKKSTKSTDYRK